MVSSKKLFPRFVTLKGDNGQLLTVHALNGVPYLTFTSLEPSRLATHEIICHKDLPDVVMIRSSNGRYWSRNEDSWIVANRDETPASSDTSSNFKIVRVSSSSSSSTVALQSLADGSYLRWFSQSQLPHGCNAVGSSCDVHTHLELCDASETALVLPQLLTLKSDNGLFLAAQYQRDINWLSFASSSKGELAAAHEVVLLPNGNAMIQNVKSGKFWRVSCVNWAWADVDRSHALTNTACHFEPVKVSATEVALKSAFSGRFLKRYTEYWKDALCGLACGMNDPATRFVVGGAVASQSLEEIAYSLKMAEVVEVKSVEVASGVATNSEQKPCDVVVQVKFSLSVSRRHRWSDSSTFVEACPRTSFTVGVPEVTSAEGSITVGAAQCFKTRMCAVVEEAVQFQSTYTVKSVEPGEEVTVKLQCSQGKCRVPFTYSAKQTRLDGFVLPTIQCVDGFFEGVSVFDTKAVVTSAHRKTPTYLPVCCSFASTAAGRRRIPAAL
ncbi:hypothetical protein SELMODRAFT_409476 [Selaginella moellendorffii]|uniref:Agglutinin domain-containing protein n=1 Tax=Selaginella moellendorffii TaxID=88036 RepID=D8RBK3_SELML|nr:uncharacterized protein LOC9631432 [Selaginella moellendorffii]EFJ30811.1 hypothetical protein SELMODRAFT_409476 [Selaginella moellendorffii]|eukprot:XP_002968557.1 uncharacterized protein LOC9631432 [Selaginella moellendorffii]